MKKIFSSKIIFIISLAIVFTLLQPVFVLAETSDNITTVAIVDLTPDTVIAGQPKVPLMSFIVSSSEANEKLKKVEVQYSGIDESDVSTLYLYRESAVSGGTFDPNTDIQMASDSSPNKGGEFDLNSSDFSMSQDTNYQFYIVADIANGATVGNTVDVKIEKNKIQFKSGNWPNNTDEPLFDPAGNSLIAAQPTLTVNKVLIPNTDTGKFNLRIDGAVAGSGTNIGDGGTTGPIIVSVGSHIVGETADTGTNLSDYVVIISGDCALDGTITLAAGEEKTCTITNIKKGKIIVDKVTNPSSDPQSFTFISNYGSQFSLTDAATPNDSGFLTPDTYSVSEVVPDDWDLTSASCSNGSPVDAISLQAGETVTCTFINTKRGSITITKLIAPESSTFTFVFNLLGLTVGSRTFENGSFGNDSNSYTFENLLPGDYGLSETIPEEWNGIMIVDCTSGTPENLTLSPGQNIACVFNNTEFSSISGRKFHDLNANGINDVEPGLSGWTIYLLSEEEEFSEETDENGFYLFSDLLPGTYQVGEELQENWFQSLPVDGFDCDDTKGYEIVLLAGQNELNNDFGNYQKGSISGVKFEDFDGDGEKDEGEQGELGLSDWTIELYDSTGETLLDFQSTDGSGVYSFIDLMPGTYVIKEVLPEGWYQTLPESNSYQVLVNSSDQISDKDFGNFKLGKISGYKFEDVNGNKVWDDDEPALEEWTINLSGPLSESTTTSQDGYYEFTGLTTGTYTISENLQSGWMQTTTNPEDIVILSGSNEVDVNLGNFKLAKISGSKWHDINNNGVRDETEPGIADWVITLTGKDRDDREVNLTTTTDENGNFSFFDVFATLPDTFYRITEEEKNNWRITYPVDSFFDVFIGYSGQEITKDKNDNLLKFGNIYYENILGGKFLLVSGTASSTLSVAVLDDVIMNIPANEGTSTISFSAGTVVSRVDGDNFAIGDINTGSVSADSLSGLGTGVVVGGVLKWGLENLGLKFSQPITVSIYVGTALNGQTLDVLRSVSGTAGWTNDGIVPPATCVVTNGLCTFQALKASFYVVIYISSPSASPSSSRPGGRSQLTQEQQSPQIPSFEEQKIQPEIAGVEKVLGPLVTGEQESEVQVPVSEVVSEVILPSGEAKEEVERKPVELKGLLAAIVDLPFSAKAILVIVGIVIIGLVILRLTREQRIKS